MVEQKPTKPTPQQQSAAQFLFFMTLEDFAKQKAKERYGWRRGRRTRHALIDLYATKANNEPLDKFRRKWKEKSGEYEQFLDELTPDIETIKSNILDSSSSINENQRKKITKRAFRRLTSINHIKNLIKIEGQTEEEKKKQIGKFTKAGVLAIVTGTIANIMTVLTVTHEIISPLIPLTAIISPQTFLIVAASYSLHYGAVYINSRVNRQLLNNPNINTSPSFTAKAAHYTATKLLPEDKKQADRAVLIGTALPTAALEPWLLAGLAVPVVGPLAATVRNTVGTVFNLGEALGSETYLGYRVIKDGVIQRRRLRKEREKVKQDSNQSPS